MACVSHQHLVYRPLTKGTSVELFKTSKILEVARSAKSFEKWFRNQRALGRAEALPQSTNSVRLVQNMRFSVQNRVSQHPET